MDPLNLMPEMASYTPGSVNLGPIVYQNDAKLTRDMAQKYKDLKIKPQVEVFDTNMISNAYNLVKAGYFDGNYFFRTVAGFMTQVGLNGDPKITAAWRDAALAVCPPVVAAAPAAG